MKRSLVLGLLAATLIVTSCGARGDSESSAEEEGGSTATTAATAPSAETVTWGELDSPCGEGDASVKSGEGPATDTLLIGVPNDRNSQVRPGLNAEFWDAATAYAKWCNDQGGIQGLQIEPVDIDGGVTNVEAAMATACTGVFALVGGGLALDNLEFSGNDGTDFHKCGLIDIPAFSVSVEKSMSNGQVQPIPNSAQDKPTEWVIDFQKVYPEQSQKMVVATSKDLPSLEAVKVQFETIVDKVGGIALAEEVDYPLVVSDWGPYAEKIIGSGATSMYFIGEPANLAGLAKSLREKGWDGVILSESNTYDDLYIQSAGAAGEGTVARSVFHPFEEADQWPAVQQYLDNMKANAPDGKVANLGLQATSSWLLFSVAADACATKNDGVIDRTCVLEEAAAVSDWTAGGTHAPTQPGVSPPGECGMLMVVKDGKWARLYPEIGGEDDDNEGFHCPTDGVAVVPPDSIPGKGAVDPSRPSL